MKLEQLLEEARQENQALQESLAELTRWRGQIATLRRQHEAETLYAEVYRLLGQVLPLRCAALRRPRPGGGYDTPFLRCDGEPCDLEALVDDELTAWALDAAQTATVPTEPRTLAATGVATVLLAPLASGGEGVRALLVAGFRVGAGAIDGLRREKLDALVLEFGDALDGLRLLEQVRAQIGVLDSLVESVPHAVLAIDRRDRIIACNTNAEFMFGFRRFLAIGEGLSDVLQGNLAETFARLALDTYSGMASTDYQIEHDIAGAVPLTLGISTALLSDPGGRPDGLVYICRDMSLSREVEKLRELDRLKSEFVQTVSHELKTPLTAILGGAEILRGEPERLAADQLEVVRIVEDGGRRLLELITDLLDLSHLESGRVGVEREEVLLQQLVRDAVTLTPATPGLHRLEIVAPDEPIFFLTDAHKLQQILENLLGNAVKYSPDGGAIACAAQLTEDGRWVQIEVSDEGIGIPPECQDRIWEKFYRVDSSTTAQIDGTGLGLAIVKHLVDMLEGEISVHSPLAHGQGTRFTLRLPYRPPEPHD